MDILHIHIPKTGGVSLQKFLLNENLMKLETFKKYNNIHRTLVDLKKLTGKNYPTFIKVAVVRNPWDRLVSSYYFIKNGSKEKKLRVNQFYQILLKFSLITFMKFLKKIQS